MLIAVRCLCMLLLGSAILSQLDNVLEDLQSGEANMQMGLDLANRADWRTAAEYFDLVLRKYDPASADAVHMLGLCALNERRVEQATADIEKAVRLSARHKDDILFSNYVEVLQRGGKYDDAERIAMQGLSLFSKSYRIRMNLASMLQLTGRVDDAIAIFREIVSEPEHSLDPTAWQKLLNALESAGMWREIEAQGRRALALAAAGGPMASGAVGFEAAVGSALHQQQRVPEALPYYLRALAADPSNYYVLSHLAAAHQVLGDNLRAKEYYKQCLPFRASDSGIRNNYGSLLLVSGDDPEAGLSLLREALQISPDLQSAVINILSHVQDELLVEETQELLERLLRMTGGTHPLLLRRALLQFPVKPTFAAMVEERDANERGLDEYIALREQALRLGDDRQPLPSLYDKIHFYLPYLGLNDRSFQQRVARAYALMSSDFSRAPQQRVRERGGASLEVLRARACDGRLRVGFMSKFFGIFEPHGLLLQGVMKYLPRSRFEVVLLAVPRGDMKPVDPLLQRSVDEMHETSLVPSAVAELIASLDLDVLVFADVLSEPINHFVSFLRLAPLQVAFWGNPITSGADSIDYFVSADCMEHPFRTRMPSSDEPYSEQVVLLGGQGIWYDRFPDSAHEYLRSINYTGVAPQPSWSRADFGLEDGWFVFFCPQSVFKMHPLFDSVLRAVVALGSHVHVVVTGGRRATWTKAYLARLLAVLGPVLAPRLHMVERVSSERFIDLLRLSDALLHPFPFDGSRTSADGIFAGVPVLTLPAEQLRGRMGAAFYRSMNLPQLVARNVSEYLLIARRLCSDRDFYRSVKSAIEQRSYLIWENMEYPLEWAQFLLKAAGQPPVSWEEFIAQSGRDAIKEQHLMQVRASNHRAFAAAFGPERWLLQGGEARLESRLQRGAVPRIFSDWASGGRAAAAAPAPAPVLGDLGYMRSREHAQIGALVRQGSLDESARLALSIFSSNSADPHFLLDLGMIQYYRGEYSEGSRLCAKAAEVMPDSALAFACMGEAYTYQGEASRALAAMARAWKLQLDQVAAPSVSLRSSIFKLPRGAIEVNYLNALVTFQRHQECVDVVTLMASLPPLTKGGSVILTLAFIDWAPSHEAAVELFERDLLLEGELHLPAGRSLLEEVRRVQRSFPMLLDLAIVCVNAVLEATDPQRKISVYERIRSMMASFNEYPLDLRADLAEAGPDSIHKNGGITLISQYFIAGSARKQRDLDDVLQTNLLNSAITQVVLLNEQRFNYSNLHSSHKIKEVLVGGRLRFADAFTYADTNLAGKTVILANADIYFDGTLHKLALSRERALNNTVLALLRFEDRESNIELAFRTDSQDAWIFHSPLNKSLSAQADFYLGAPRCDNRLAELLRLAGHPVRNPPFLLHAVELDSAKAEPGWDEGRNMYGTNGSVLGDGRHLLIDTWLHLPIL